MRRSRRAVLLVALAATFPFGGRATEVATLRPWTGAPLAPAMELLRPDGTPLSLHDLRDKVVLVNFWATWCEPCMAEMPALQRMREQFDRKHFEVLGVNYKEGPARIGAFVKKTGVTFPIVRDTDGAVARAWNARVFPSSYLVDRNGQVRYVLVGEADWTSPALVSTIHSLLASPPQR